MARNVVKTALTTVSHVAPNTLNRQFEVDKPNQAWVADFTYIRTHEGWLYLTIVLDLFSRQIVGWSMKNNPKADLVIDALMMGLWRRKPTDRVRSRASVHLFRLA